jgi:hypothetical protein
MASLLKKYQALTNDQSPFKIMTEMDYIVKKQRSKYLEFRANPNAHKSHIKFFTRIPHSNNVPIHVSGLDEMYAEMRKAIHEMTGTNFVLGMLTDEGKYEVWRRPSQPCQGGEMRKYGITHDDSTRPQDPRPGDLLYPFPDGKPIAVGSRVEGLNKSHPYQIAPTSVYRRAYGTESNIELVKKGSGEIKGIIALNADLVEPTMMVHLLRDARYWDMGQEICGDLSPQAVFLLKKMKGNYGSCIRHHSYVYVDSEDNCSFYNLKKIAAGGIEASRDLSGGTLGNRFDYNRPEIDSAYRGKVGENTPIQEISNTIFFGHGKNKNHSYDISAKMLKEFTPAIEQYLKEKAA